MAPPSDEHHCSVLIVEDDRDVQELLRVALAAEGYTIGFAENGLDALHYVRSHAETCVILLDLMLPLMDGAAFRAAQVRDRSLAWIPIVAMSGAVDADQRAREIGARALIRKPIDLDEVRRALKAARCRRVRPQD